MKISLSLSVLVAFLALPSLAFAQDEPNETKHHLYGGHNTGALLSKSLVVTSQLDWLNAWSKNLGGSPPADLPHGYIGVLVFASYPGHLISLHPQGEGSAMKVICRQVPLPDNRSHIAPAAWAAGVFRADSVTLEDCP